MTAADGMMCPHCGVLVRTGKRTGLTYRHPDGGWMGNPPCPGSGQHPRYAWSDARPLWNGHRNTFFGQEPWK